MKIRTVKKSDLKTIAKLDRQIFKDTTNQQALKVFQDSFKRKIPGACLVAEDNGKLIGAILSEKRLTFSPNTSYISTLFVRKEWRHKGIGKLLLERCLAAMKKSGMKAVSLTVAKENTTAFSLYKKHGFKPVRILCAKKL